MVDLVVTGASGRLGRLLRSAWLAAPPDGVRPIWAGRQQGFDLQWDILAEDAPLWPRGAVVLHLAGVVRAGDVGFGANVAMAAPVLAACRRNAAHRLLVASTAGVYAPGPEAADETAAPAPTGDYGRSKLAAEKAFLADRSGLNLCVLRIGNVVGADALLGPRNDGGPILLDPVPGRTGGPVRSWIGPIALARVLACLAKLAVSGDLPTILNLAAQPPLPMAGLLQSSGRAWGYGPANPAVVPDAVMDTSRLEAVCPVPRVTPASLIAELASVTGGWG